MHEFEIARVVYLVILLALVVGTGAVRRLGASQRWFYAGVWGVALLLIALAYEWLR